MRPTPSLLVVALLAGVPRAAVAGGNAPRRGEALAVPVESVATAGSGVVALRAPPGEMVLFASSTFTMGAAGADVAFGLSLCAREVKPALCELYSTFGPAFDPRTLEEVLRTEFDAHPVTLSAYWLDRREVSVADYERCVAAGPCAEPPYREGGERFRRDELPVSLVSWDEAKTYCAWRGARLPTEAEWERAARGVAGRRFPWGNNYHRGLSNHGTFRVGIWGFARHPLPDNSSRLLEPEIDASDGHAELAPVGSFPDGRTPEGLDDMAGNVAEWVFDLYDDHYDRESTRDPSGPSESAGGTRVVRGGGFVHGGPLLRTTARLPRGAGDRASWIGFRCAKSAQPEANATKSTK